MVQEYKSYDVRAQKLEGVVRLVEADHPTSVNVNEEFSWHAVGHVENAPVSYPGVGYYYVDGPADSITIVRTDGVEEELQKGYVYAIFIIGRDQPECTNIDSRVIARGAKFPEEGTYTIKLCSGYVSEEEAPQARRVFGNLAVLKTRHVRTLVGMPVTVTATPSLEVALSYFLAGLPIITVVGAIAINELNKLRR